ncbi:MAG TPA: exodeoxyribonuclease VII large subunit [Candidatus Absconditabacterales bacterium]|nr:exodeoxyribonuclease VII large subunit [Candidatus Absconditabacterales bacterium]HNG97580.1 exodeoxyribonuclease VII large subunit [Candidatus Absconditabacterales bacterium]
MSPQLSLSQFTTIVARGIDELRGGETWLIVAEVNKIKSRKTRFYLELVEFEQERIKAHVSAVVINQAIVRSALKSRGLTLDELVGQQLLVHCLVRYHKDHGIQLEIVDISSEYTLGHLKKKEQSIKDQLTELGIIHHNKKTSLGLPPYHIAVISSRSSEGLKDFLNTMEESVYQFRYTLFDCAVHGNAAVSEIYSQLKSIYQQLSNPPTEGGLFDSYHHPYDAVVIVRGGGGTSGIMRHNDLHIAKGICYMPIPVIMAVGHTNDQYLLDEIAWMSAKTPTDAAYQLIDRYDNLKQELDATYATINNAIALKYTSFINDLQTIYKYVNEQIVYQQTTIKENCQKRYELVMSTRPEKMLQSGYALLQSLEGEYLTTLDIQNAEVGYEYLLSIYDQKWKIRLMDLQ